MMSDFSRETRRHKFAVFLLWICLCTCLECFPLHIVKDLKATSKGVIDGIIIFDEVSRWESQTGRLGSYQADDAGNYLALL